MNDSRVNETAGGDPPTRVDRRKSWKALAFRLLAVLVGLSPFLLLEAGLRLGRWRPPPGVEDPYVGFQGLRPLFERQGDRYVIPESRREFFCEESFPVEKAADEFRIFCLGGSTVQGRPYAIETSFTNWLEIDLNAADSRHRWEVVNCGGVSYASYRLTPILKECLGYSPDLFILYTGHNEFLEERSYSVQKRRSPLLAKTHAAAMRTRVCQFAQSVTESIRQRPKREEERTVLTGEVDALLDYRGGLEWYHRDEDWRRGVVRQYELNLRIMIHLAEEAGVPLVLVNPTSNLRDSPPFKFELAKELNAQQRQRVNTLWNDARRIDKLKPEQAVRLLLQALELDPGHAGIWYHLARTCEAQGDWEKAREAFLRSKDCDVCPLRMLESMHEVVLRVARETGTPLVDVRRFFDAQAKDGIPGNDLFVDHVHPTIKGHRQIAGLLLDELISQGRVRPETGWERRREEAVKEQLADLGEEYFARGKQRLDGLRRWSQGRAFRVRGVDDLPSSGN